MDKKLQIQILANTKQAVEDIKKLENEIKKFSNGVNKSNTNLKKQETQFNKIAKGIRTVVTAYAGFQVVKNIVGTVADFEQSLARLSAVSQASAGQLESLKKKAMDLGGSTEYTSSQVVQGMNYLAMAGFKTNDILKSTSDVLNLATIGQMDLARASDIASNVLSGFGMKADEMNKVVDVMSVTITNANTNIEQLGQAMKFAAPTAHSLGISIEETSAALGVLGNAGLQGTIAGTNLAMVMTRLAAPVGRAKEALKELGVKAYDSQGKFVGLKNVLEQLNAKMKNMTQQQRMAYLKDIFGQESLKAVLILLSEVDKSYSKLLEKNKKAAGVSAEMAKKMRDTLEGNFKTLMSALEKLALTIGQQLLPALTEFLKLLTAGVSDVTDFYEAHQHLINAIIELTAAFYSLAKAKAILDAVVGAEAIARYGMLSAVVSMLVTKMRMLKIAIMSLAEAHPVLLALTAAILATNAAFDEMSDEIKELNKETDKLIANNKDFENIMKKLQDAMVFKNGRKEFQLTGDEIDRLKKKTEKLTETTKAQIKELQNKIKDGDNVWDKMLGLDKTDEYKRQLATLQDRLKVLQATENKLKNIKPFEGTKDSAVKAKQATEKLTKEQKKYLKELDKKLEKEKNTTKTILELKNEEIEKARALLGETKYFEEAKAKIIEYYNLKEIRQFKDKYRQRVEQHKVTIEQLKNKEKDLADKIADIQTRLNARLKQLETDRLNAIENIEDKIHNLKMSSASSYTQYIDKQKQAEIKLAKAKEAIKNGELQQAKRYMSQYKSIVSSIANTEIKEKKKVKKFNWDKFKWEEKEIEIIRVSKKKANDEAMRMLNKLKSVTNDYYAKAKAQEQAAARAKMQNLKAELEATKAQLQLEVQRLNLEKQLIEALTGKKVNIDTSAALQSIKNLDTQIKQLDEKLKQKKDVKVDTNKAKAELKKVENTKAKVKVEADTKPALAGVLEIKDKITKEKLTFKFYANDKEANDKVKKFNLKVKNLKPVVKVKSDVSQALHKLSQIPKTITTIHHIKTVETHAAGGIAGFRKVQGRIPGDDPLNSDDVPALLTRGEFVVKRDTVKHYGEDFLYRLNNKLLPKFATGGLVEIGRPQQLITQLSNLSGGSSGGYGDGDIISKLDDYLSTLKELLEHFRGTNRPEKAEIESTIQKVEDTKSKYENDQKAITDYKASIKGKTLDDAGYKEYESKLKTLQSKLKTDEESVKKLDETVNALVQKINDYLAQVDKYKDLIRKKISQSGIDENKILPPDFDYVMDLDRLKNFYSRLNSLNIPDKEAIKIDFQRFAKNSANNTPRYLQVGYSLMNNPAYRPTDYNIMATQFLTKYGVNDSLLQYRFANLLKYNKQAATLSDDNLNILMQDILKDKLPKFATGGLIKLANGGKLPGYGGGDRNLALLEDGEFIVRKEAVSMFGTDLFEKLNSFKLPKFATGGYVGDLPSANNTSGDTVNVNFKFPDGANFEMQSDEMTAKQLASYFKRIM